MNEEPHPMHHVALVQLEMLMPQNPEKHIADACAPTDTTGKQGVDLIVLPEGDREQHGIPVEKGFACFDETFCRGKQAIVWAV
ncbi:MAG: hypothetical protein DRP97_00200 [Candidatus Latescibacterota bacterium]|nr:MAG: hypothetical protein DRP97_00200 [Candidatus Latescibacterota bacterium]